MGSGMTTLLLVLERCIVQLTLNIRKERGIMATDPRVLSCEIEVQPGEQIQLPRSITERVGVGHWLVTIQPAGTSDSRSSIRDHSAFLGSYSAGDEGLYDNYPAR
jgi:hypothetical protein